jgi:hypothetical protein
MSYLNEKSSGSGLENQENGREDIGALTTQHPLPVKVDTNIPDKWRNSVGTVRLRTKSHRVCFCFVISILVVNVIYF